jgi:hypothetical protein
MRQALRAALITCNTLRKRSKQDAQSRKALVICLAMGKKGLVASKDGAEAAVPIARHS